MGTYPPKSSGALAIAHCWVRTWVACILALGLRINQSRMSFLVQN
jgi:hypothetical protein